MATTEFIVQGDEVIGTKTNFVLSWDEAFYATTTVPYISNKTLGGEHIGFENISNFEYHNDTATIPTYNIWRIYFRVDTSSLSSTNITTAKISIYNRESFTPLDKSKAILTKTNLVTSLETLGDEAYSPTPTRARELHNSSVSSSYSSLEALSSSVSLLPNGSHKIYEINDVSYINKNGYTYFCLKIEDDFNKIVPEPYIYGWGEVQVYASDVLPTLAFKLIVDDTPYLIPPDGLKFDNYNSSTGKLTVSHLQSSSSLITKYILSYKSSTDTSYTDISIDKPSSPTAAVVYSFLVDATKTYTLYARAQDASLNISNPSTSITWTNSAGPVLQVPSNPRNVLAAVGSSPNSVKVTWDAPTEANGVLDTYVITNKVSGTINTLAAANTVLQTEFTGLSYNEPYSFGVKVNNNVRPNDYSYEVLSNIITLVKPNIEPSAPTNLNIIIAKDSCKVTWEPPLSSGEYAVTKYKLTLYNRATALPIVSNIVPFTTLEKTIFGLLPNTTYYITLSASNRQVEGLGYGPDAVSLDFTTQNWFTKEATVDVSYNYKRFYDAPVDLSVENGDFLYEENLTRTVYSNIVNSDLTFPLVLPDGNNAISLDVIFSSSPNTTVRYDLGLDKQIYTELKTLVDELQLKCIGLDFEVLSVSNINNKNMIMAQAKKATKSFLLSTRVPVVENTDYFNVNSYIFGSSPTYFTGYEEPLVVNHIPTPEYDRYHHKCLVENIPISNVKTQPLYYPTEVNPNDSQKIRIEEESTTGLFTIQLPHNSLHPKKVELMWLNNENSYTTLVDYYGSGYLFEKIKLSDVSGFSTLPDTSTGYGKINYRQGTIFNIYLKNYRPSAIIGQNVKFPINVYTDGNLILKVFVKTLNTEGTTNISINIPKGNYTAEQLITYLNSGINGTLSTYSLEASYLNGQIVIVNKKIGPNYKIEPVNLSSGITAQILGFKPVVIYPPRIYISYSYTLNPVDRNHYIWYQTPHFILKVNSKDNTGLFTMAHLNYILNKVKSFKPATTVFDGIKLNINTQDSVEFLDSFNSLEYVAVNHPFIAATIPFDSEIPATTVTYDNVRVINPDGQEYPVPG